MKKVLVGGFLTLAGSIWALALILMASANLTSGWSTPPGRILTTMAELHITPCFVISLLFTALGIILMAVEYFKKDN